MRWLFSKYIIHIFILFKAKMKGIIKVNMEVRALTRGMMDTLIVFDSSHHYSGYVWTVYIFLIPCLEMMKNVLGTICEFHMLHAQQV